MKGGGTGGGNEVSVMEVITVSDATRWRRNRKKIQPLRRGGEIKKQDDQPAKKNKKGDKRSKARTFAVPPPPPVMAVESLPVDGPSLRLWWEEFGAGVAVSNWVDRGGWRGRWARSTAGVLCWGKPPCAQNSHRFER